MSERIVTRHISPYIAWQGPESEAPVLPAGEASVPPKDAPTVRCNKCGEAFHEDELQRCYCGLDGGRCDACPTCGTDHYLMDIPRGAS